MRTRLALLGMAAMLAAPLSGCGLGSERIEPGTRSGQISPPTVNGFEAIRDGERLGMPRSVAIGRIGRREGTVYVMRRVGAPRDQPVLIWLHGYGTNNVSSQERWLTHMTKRATVVFPVYVRPPFPVGPRFGQIAWPITARALRAALARLRFDPRKLVVGGYSLGAALADDYALAWKDEGLPAPRGLYALFGGRALKTTGEVYLPRPGTKLWSGTELVQVASPNDLLAGTREASFMMAIGSNLKRRKLILIKDFAYGDHFAPTRTTRVEQRLFWKPLDALIDRVERRADIRNREQALERRQREQWRARARRRSG